IGDGDAMRVAREVPENGFGSAERLLRIDHPFRSPERGEEGGERVGISERCVRAEELELAGLMTAHGRPTRNSVDRRSTSRHPLTENARAQEALILALFFNRQLTESLRVGEEALADPGGRNVRQIA